MTKLIFIMAILLSGSVFAKNLDFNLSFKDMQSYVQSLQRIREGLGHSMPNVVVGTTSVYQINAGATNDGVVITLEGLDHYGSETTSSVRFVLSPQNLYLTGFIYNRVYYHFRDETNITVGPDFADSTEAINLASNYTDLQRWSGLSRQGLVLSRDNLNSGLITLMSINPQSVTRAEAGTLLRFAHVIPEALRFRQIQRNVRTIFDLRPEPNVYSLSDSDIELTNSWEQLSQNFIHTTPGGQNAIRVGTIFLQNNNAILAALAMLAYCKSSTGNMSYSEGYCEAHSSKSYVVNGVVWDSKTLFFI
ncbi:hypothetical protein B0T92_12640 [Salmonella enterica]|nr:hypothetical protein [Salmonella enterica]EAY0054317.1 hypothetical protein [Salmonella enterica]EHF1888225.1 hypothetical protein [Salmonella enterica]